MHGKMCRSSTDVVFRTPVDQRESATAVALAPLKWQTEVITSSGHAHVKCKLPRNYV